MAHVKRGHAASLFSGTEERAELRSVLDGELLSTQRLCRRSVAQVFHLCTKDLDEFISSYMTFVRSDEFDFRNRSYALCEIALFHASLAVDGDQAYQRLHVNLVSHPLAAYRLRSRTACPMRHSRVNIASTSSPFYCTRLRSVRFLVMPTNTSTSIDSTRPSPFVHRPFPPLLPDGCILF